MHLVGGWIVVSSHDRASDNSPVNTPKCTGNSKDMEGSVPFEGTLENLFVKEDYSK